MLSLEVIEAAGAMQCLGDVSWVMGYFHEISHTLLFMLSGHVGIGFSEYILGSCRSYTLKVCYVVRSWGSGNRIFIRGSWGSWIFDVSFHHGIQEILDPELLVCRWILGILYLEFVFHRGILEFLDLD